MTDAELIYRLGGPKKVAELLGLDVYHGGWQRVCNWVHRGIPWKVKAERAALFEMALDAQRARATQPLKPKPKTTRKPKLARLQYADALRAYRDIIR